MLTKAVYIWSNTVKEAILCIIIAVWKLLFLFIHVIKLHFQHCLLQSSMSHNPSKMVLLSWFSCLRNIISNNYQQRFFFLWKQCKKKNQDSLMNRKFKRTGFIFKKLNHVNVLTVILLTNLKHPCWTEVWNFQTVVCITVKTRCYSILTISFYSVKNEYVMIYIYI